MPGGMSRMSLMASDGDAWRHRVGVGSGAEVDLDEADAGKRAGLHVVDAAGERELALEVIGDVGFDLLRRHAGVEGRDGDDRQVDGREHVDRHIGRR